MAALDAEQATALTAPSPEERGIMLWKQQLQEAVEAAEQEQLVKQGETSILSGEMPSDAQLAAMGKSKAEALGDLAVLRMNQFDDTAVAEGMETIELGEFAADARDRYDEISARSAIKIQNGFACFPEGDPLNENVRMVTPLENCFDIAVHGTPTAVGFGTTKVNMSPRLLANYILHSEGYRGQNIRLLSCSTGKSMNGEYCFAEELANILNVEVYAPNDTLYIFPSGRISIGDDGSGSFILYKPNQRRRIR